MRCHSTEHWGTICAMVLGCQRAAFSIMLLLVCSITFGQQAKLRVNSSLVLIPAHVTTVAGASVTDLKKEDFVLLEDGVPQNITHFANDDAPVSVGVVVDTSGSMRDKMGRVIAAATEFFGAANPEDEFFLVEFSQGAHLKVPFTHEWHEITREIARVKPFGLTALVDAIHLSLSQMKQAHNARKALVILSDGGDNFSRRTVRQLREMLLESDAQVYALGIFDSDYSVRHTREERNGPGLLTEVALETGGRNFPVENLDGLALTGKEIARDLRNEYVLGYSPSNPAADGKYHRVNLKLKLPGGAELRTYYRRGYYAPAD